jgi:hypothetical protein
LGGSDGAVFEVRDYSALLELSQELQIYSGYLDTKGIQEKNGLIGRFDWARRKFIDELCQDWPDDADLALPAVLADLERISAAGHFGDETVAYVRQQLTKHIRKQAGKNPFQRFVTHWTPPTMMGVAAVAALYFFYLRFSGALS